MVDFLTMLKELIFTFNYFFKRQKKVSLFTRHIYIMKTRVGNMTKYICMMHNMFQYLFFDMMKKKKDI